MAEALQLLTGAPSDEIYFKSSSDEDDENKDLVWAKLVSACEARSVVRLFLKLNFTTEQATFSTEV
jgi:hypothetical protein